MVESVRPAGVGRRLDRHQQQGLSVPAPARWALGAVFAVLGLALAVVGAWTAVSLGPSGEAQFTASSRATGAIVVGPDVLNSVDVPVRVTATRGNKGALWLGVAPTTDARAALATSAVSTVSGVHYPAGTLDLRPSGSGTPAGIGTADVWRLSARGTGSAELVVGQGRGPETAVVASGDGTTLTDVTMTLTWANRAWFFEALAAAVIGAIITAFALGDLWHSRPAARRRLVEGTRRSRVRT